MKATRDRSMQFLSTPEMKPRSNHSGMIATFNLGLEPGWRIFCRLLIIVVNMVLFDALSTILAVCSIVRQGLAILIHSPDIWDIDTLRLACG